MIPKEFESSNLASELKAGKKRLELVLHGLTNEQCRMAGAVPSGSISMLISRLVRNEFLALKEECEQVSGSKGKQSSAAEQQTRFLDKRRQAEPRSIQSLLAEFEVVRSAIIRLVEQSAGNSAYYGTLAEIYVTRFNDHFKQIERWKASQLFGFSATQLLAKTFEPELNAACRRSPRKVSFWAIAICDHCFSIS